MSNFVNPLSTYHSNSPYTTGQTLPAVVINALCNYIELAPNFATGGSYDISSGGPLVIQGGSGSSANYVSLLGTANRIECKYIGIGINYDSVTPFQLRVLGASYFGGTVAVDNNSGTIAMAVNNSIVLSGKGRISRASGAITGAGTTVTISVEQASRFFVKSITGSNMTVQIDRTIGLEGDTIMLIFISGGFQALIQIWNGSSYVTSTTLGLSAAAGVMRWVEYEFQSGAWVRTRARLFDSAEN